MPTITKSLEKVDTKSIIVKSLKAQKYVYGDRDPECLSIKRLQATINFLFNQLHNTTSSDSIFINISSDAIERDIIYSSSILGLDEEAELVYLKNKDLQDDIELNSNDFVWRTILKFTSQTKDEVF